jgi:hypothetical protein
MNKLLIVVYFLAAFGVALRGMWLVEGHWGTVEYLLCSWFFIMAALVTSLFTKWVKDNKSTPPENNPEEPDAGEAVHV